MPRAVLPALADEPAIELEFATFGDPGNPTLLLVNGYTSQMIVWETELIERLVAQGLHVVIYDNRDVGFSTKLDGLYVQPMKVLQSIIAGEPVKVPYTLSAMAADGMGLLTHLGVDQAHIAGVSMGGMIVQMMAIEHPDRVLSLCSIMSSPGHPDYGRPSAEAISVLLAPPPIEREAYIDGSIRAKVWLSKRYFSEETTRDRSARQFDRIFYPEGFTRQLAAIYATGDRSERLQQLDVPTLVIHGRDDELISPSGGERTAELIDGSRYLLLSDMGHDLPAPLAPVFAEAIAGHIRTSNNSNEI
ncbi:MAG: alpha/beta hydrolase [Actinomycetota bacterium]|uniref:alpha/beta fold hydrolase n=1 Tax=uncultured Ilumatobacter sp. TaxID=879968 RepID=UPI00374F3747|nr:alpha/beta hydrolase [Actinomycetota bacterium]